MDYTVALGVTRLARDHQLTGNSAKDTKVNPLLDRDAGKIRDPTSIVTDHPPPTIIRSPALYSMRDFVSPLPYLRPHIIMQLP